MTDIDRTHKSTSKKGTEEQLKELLNTVVEMERRRLWLAGGRQTEITIIIQ